MCEIARLTKLILTDAPADRNAILIKECLKLTSNGSTTSAAIIKVAKKYEEHKISPSLVKRLMYDPGYPNAKEAWEIVNKEMEELKKSPRKNLCPAHSHKTQSLQA